jgi:hypothetical protein
MSKAESAELILRLYELRRDATMREARNWIASFMPESAEDVIKAMINEQSSAYFRMVTSYWDMAASLVNNGAIDEQMFNDANGEHNFVFSKVEPFLEQVRQTIGNPNMLMNLEKLVMRQPDAKEKLGRIRAMVERRMKAQAEMSKSA